MLGLGSTFKWKVGQRRIIGRYDKQWWFIVWEAWDVISETSTGRFHFFPDQLLYLSVASTVFKWVSHLVSVLSRLALETTCQGLNAGPTILSPLRGHGWVGHPVEVSVSAAIKGGSQQYVTHRVLRELSEAILVKLLLAQSWGCFKHSINAHCYYS